MASINIMYKDLWNKKDIMVVFRISAYKAEQLMRLSRPVQNLKGYVYKKDLIDIFTK